MRVVSCSGIQQEHWPPQISRGIVKCQSQHEKEIKIKINSSDSCDDLFQRKKNRFCIIHFTF